MFGLWEQTVTLRPIFKFHLWKYAIHCTDQSFTPLVSSFAVQTFQDDGVDQAMNIQRF